MNEKYYTAKEAKEKLSVSAQTLLRWRENGTLIFKQLGPKKIWYLKSTIDQMVD